MGSKVFFIPVSNSRNPDHVKKRFKRLLQATGCCDEFRTGEFVAVKMHMGEQGNRGHVSPRIIKALAEKIKSRGAKPFVTDTNVLYQGRRMNAVDHLILADEHGFNLRTLGCPVIISDGLFGENSEDVRVDQKHFQMVNLAKPVLYLENLMGVAHVTGHLITGFAGGLKNLGMGFASRAGKLRQHSSIKPRIKENRCVFCRQCMKTCPASAIEEKDGRAFINEGKCIGCGECVVSCKYDAISPDYGENVDILTEKMMEYALGSIQNIKKGFYFNFITHVTRNCDCLAKDEKPIIPDIGIVASSDLLACDRAAVDLIISRQGDIFHKAYPQAADWQRQFDCAEKVGLGSQKYDLVEVNG